MNKNKIINLVAIIAAVAVVGSTSAVFIARYKKEGGENVTAGKETVTSFEIIGNADSENIDITTQVVTNTAGEKETELLTDKNGVTVTDSNGKYVGVTSNKPQTQHSGTSGSASTTKITASTPITDSNASQAAGAFGFTWDAASGVFYSTSDPWQRQFGYNQYYDKFGSYVALWYDTVRIKFNYDGYDWLIQFWKGQYGFLLLGAEAGVYYKHEGDTSSQYSCTDNSKRLKIGYTCYNKGDVLFTRDYQDTWWLTGFVPGRLDKFADRSQLKMKIRITLKNEEMKNAFVEALTQPGTGFTQGNANDADTFYTSGNDVYLMWQTDRGSTS